MKRICLIISIFALALAGCKKDTAPQPPLESDNIIVYGKSIPPKQLRTRPQLTNRCQFLQTMTYINCA